MAPSTLAASDPDASHSALEITRASLRLPFYLYEGLDFDDGSWFEPCARGLRGETYVEDQYSGEHYFLAALRAHRWRVTDPTAALLFVVPLYANAALQPSVSGMSCNGTHYQVLFDRTASAVAASEYYQRHQGADHLLVSNSWKIAQKPPQQAPWSKHTKLNVKGSGDYFRHVFRNAIVGHMETRHGGSDDSSFWRCSVISPYTANLDADSERRASHTVPPAARERDVSFYFQGGANNRGTYGYAFRQAALAQLEDLPRAHISAFSLPGNPVGCRGAVTTNCKAGRSNPMFRSLMRRSRFNLVLRGDSPSSRRLYDGIAVGAISVLVSDQTWTVGLPFGCLVPWRRMAFTLSERPFETASGAARELKALDELAPPILARVQRLANRHRRDVLWNANGSRVAENILITAALRCLPGHVTRHRAGRPAAVGAALRTLKSMCPYQDASLTCRQPDSANCAGCETGDVAGSTPVEHCCATSCPTCNRTGRCLPPSVYYGDPLTHDPARREALAAYLGQKDRDLAEGLKTWRARVGRPTMQATHAKQHGKGGGGGRGAMPSKRPTARRPPIAREANRTRGGG